MILWRLRDYFCSNRKYLKRYRKDKKLSDLNKFIFKSDDLEYDLDELVNWCRCYCYVIEGKDEYYHEHSLKTLLGTFIYLYEEDPSIKIKLDKETFHPDEVIMVESFLELLKEKGGKNGS